MPKSSKNWAKLTVLDSRQIHDWKGKFLVHFVSSDLVNWKELDQKNFQPELTQIICIKHMCLIGIHNEMKSLNREHSNSNAGTWNVIRYSRTLTEAKYESMKIEKVYLVKRKVLLYKGFQSNAILKNRNCLCKDCKNGKCVFKIAHSLSRENCFFLSFWNARSEDKFKVFTTLIFFPWSS